MTKYSNGKEEAVIYKISIKTPKGIKKYVGVTIASPPEKRFKSHLKIANNIKHYSKIYGKVYPIHRAIAKHGIKNVKFSIIEEVNGNFKKGLKREIFWIKKLKSHISLGNGYNLTWGGEGVPHTDKMRKSKSKKMRARRDNGLMWNQVITSKQALEIKKLIMSQILTNREIAKKYNCGVMTVGAIAKNKVYSDILKNTPVLEHGKNGWYNTGYKNRSATGGNKASIFNASQIIKIRKLYSRGNSAPVIARKFKTSRQCIWRIISGRSYQEVK